MVFFMENQILLVKMRFHEKSQAEEFRDILVFSAEGIQTLRMAITSAIQSDIKVKLMPAGTGYATPGIPVFSIMVEWAM